MKKFLAVAGCALLLDGCAAAGLTVAGAGAGVAMGTGVERTLSGITYKTFTAPVKDVRAASVRTLDHMEMKVTKDAETPEGWEMTATATDREIDIQLEKLTPNTTRMRVVANRTNSFFNDASTATEIILQTAQTLDDTRTNIGQATKTGTKGGKRS